LGSYQEAISEFWLHIGDGSDHAMVMNEIGVADNDGPWNDLRDRYSAHVLMRDQVSLSMTLNDTTETAFSSPALPTTLNLAAFSDRTFILSQGHTGMGFIYGLIDVPEPTAFALALSIANFVAPWWCMRGKRASSKLHAVVF
jgi:hypothetical protein